MKAKNTKIVYDPLYNNNNKTCNAHISTLLGVQGAVKPKTKHNTKKNRHNKISH